MERLTLRRVGSTIVAATAGCMLLLMAGAVVDPKNGAPGNEAGTEMSGVNDTEAFSAFADDISDPRTMIFFGLGFGIGTGLVLATGERGEPEEQVEGATI